MPNAPSSVQATADLLHSASDFRTPVQCEWHPKGLAVKSMMKRATNQIIEASITRRNEKLYVQAAMKNGALLDA